MRVAGLQCAPPFTKPSPVHAIVPRTAVVSGHSGLVGRELVSELLACGEYARVTVVGRRRPAQEDARLRFVESNLDDLQRRHGELEADDAFCCLGTTLRAAGSRAAFERVDFHMVVEFARAARAAGAQRFFLVSAQSSSSHSPFFYSRVKGRAEQAVQAVGFDAVHVLQPSLLLGKRNERRPGEAIAQRVAPWLNPLMVGPLRPYRAIPAGDVAQAMVQLARRDDRGVHVHALPLGRGFSVPAA